MRKLLSLFLALVMVFGIVVAVPTAAEENVSVKLSSAKAAAGDSFTLKLTADKLLTAARVRVNFDNTKFELTDVVMANGETNFNDSEYDQTVGFVQIFAIELEELNLTKAFELDVTLEFTVKEDVAEDEYTFTVTDVDGDPFYGEDCETELVPVFTNGIVTVGEEEEKVPGDINGDGKFEYRDVVYLFAVLRNKAEAPEWFNTDINRDNVFEYRDVVYLYAVLRNKADFK